MLTLQAIDLPVPLTILDGSGIVCFQAKGIDFRKVLEVRFRAIRVSDVCYL